MRSVMRLVLVVALAGTAASCGKERKDEGAAAAAGGEILPRSISDDMLPHDTVRSQPPLAPVAKGSGKTDGAGSSASRKEGADEAGEDTPAADAPAAAEPVTPTAE